MNRILCVLMSLLCLCSLQAAPKSAVLEPVPAALSGLEYLTRKKPDLKADYYIFLRSASWCGPCRMIAPILKDLATEYKDSIVVYKVDTDQEKELSAAMGIRSLPTVVFIPQEGQPQIIVGAADKDTFKRAVQEVLLKK